MPTERFYRLSQKKKTIICEAIRKEFARVPFDKVSINQIVHNADISRGSFYTYFHDKYDAMEFMINQDFSDIRRLCEKALLKHNGDLFEMFRALFEYLVERLQSSSDILNIAKNVINIQNGHALMEYFDHWMNSELSNPAQNPDTQLLTMVNKTHLKLQTTEELYSLFMMGFHAIMYSIQQYYYHPDSLDSIRRLFEIKLNILKRGAYRITTAKPC